MPTPLRDRYIIAARCEGYIGNHTASVELLTEGLEQFPGDIRLLRHRGHRKISMRDFDGAVTDLQACVEMLPSTEDEYEMYQRHVEPDGMRLILGKDAEYDHHPKVSDVTDPELAAEYNTTLHASVWYHLGVAHYVRGEFAEAADAMQHAHDTARHYEGLVASLDWVYMSLRRLGRDADAAKVLDRFQEVVDDADLTGLGYADRLHLYSGDLDPDGLRQRVTENRLVAATIGYGLGNWYLYNGDEETARSVFADVVATGATAAFGYIAAEIDLAATVS